MWTNFFFKVSTPKFKLFWLSLLLFILVCHFFQGHAPARRFKKSLFRTISSSMELLVEDKPRLEIILALVVCGDLEYLNVILKSAIIFSQDAHLHFIFFTDEETTPNLEAFMAELHELTETINLDFTYELKLTSIPDDFTTKKNPGQIRCTNQRLFFPDLLPEVDALLYLDMDTVILGNLSTIWAEFGHMNESQMVAIGPDSSMTYNENSPVPFVGNQGVNNGVILMNLTRMRQFDFVTKAAKVFRKYENVTRYFDQDVINALFATEPTGIRVLSCKFNFFAYCCTHLFCNDSTTEGVFIMHGNGGWLRRDIPTSTFPWVYKAMRNVTLQELQESPMTFLDELAPTYNQQNISCFSLNPAILFKNAYAYFSAIANP